MGLFTRIICVIVVAGMSRYFVQGQQHKMIKYVDKMRASGKVDQAVISTVHGEYQIFVSAVFKGSQKDVEALEKGFQVPNRLLMDGISIGGKQFTIQEADSAHAVGKVINGTTYMSAYITDRGIVLGLSDGSAKDLQSEVHKTSHHLRSHGY